MSSFVRRIHTSTLRVGAKSHYQILGVSRNASSKEIRAAFIKLSKQLHPDVNEPTARKNDISFVDINEAYSILSNPIARREYDLRQTQGPSLQHSEHYKNPFTSDIRTTHRREHAHYFYGPQQNTYYYNEEQRRFSNATVAGLLCAFLIFGSALQLLRFRGFMKSQRAAAERSRQHSILYTEAIEKARKNAHRRNLKNT